MSSVPRDINGTALPIGTNVTCPNNVTIIIPIAAPIWTSRALFYLLICIIGFICNGSTLLMILCDRQHRTASFNVYIIILLSTNLLASMVQYPLAVMYERHRQIYYYIGKPAWSVYLYCQNVLTTVMVNIHAIMAANRMWAILFPVSYRSHHSRKLALITCLVAWVYVHIVEGGFVVIAILDMYYLQTDLKKFGCKIRPSQAVLDWATVSDLLVFAIPVVFVIVSFPVVVVVRLKYQRQVFLERRRGLAPPVSVRRSSSKFVVLTVLTLCVAVFYAPQIFFYLRSDFTGVFGQTWFLYTCQAMVDPILFVLALEPLRLSAVRLLTCRGSTRVQAANQ
ncbi:hypothetical protein BV898_15372 [Hypsibius exemplaris]|uniref:G-protein coupled receptors family 1 profile domain-containing protein n=1 Tax=Hypsibius exemplaris TaxID=2072580 RepID=A0A9X6RKA4_HYPEX|nr:hypothetical protein BV898_15372 [Hypsibius exemplaris]